MNEMCSIECMVKNVKYIWVRRACRYWANTLEMTVLQRIRWCEHIHILPLKKTTETSLWQRLNHLQSIWLRSLNHLHLCISQSSLNRLSIFWISASLNSLSIIYISASLNQLSFTQSFSKENDWDLCKVDDWEKQRGRCEKKISHTRSTCKVYSVGFNKFKDQAWLHSFIHFILFQFPATVSFTF